MKKRFSLWLALAVCLFLTTVVPAGAEQQTTILTGKVRTTVTRCPQVHFNGIVESVLMHPGEKVSKGQPVFRYIMQPEARRALQREVNQGASTENLKAQALELGRQLSEAQAQRNKARSLAASGLGSNQASDRLEYNVQSLENSIELINESIAKAQESFDMRLMELSEFFDAEIVEGAVLPEFLLLKSPIDGYVLSVAPDMNPGATFQAGAMPVSIGQMDPMLIQVPVYEAEVSAINVGDEAVVEIPSLRSKTFKATVTEIAWVSNEMDVSQASYFNVELTIPNPDLELKPGFKAVVRFTLN